MAVIQTVSKDCTASKGFALMLDKKFLELREHCIWQVEVYEGGGNTIIQNELQYIAPSLGHKIFSLIITTTNNNKPTVESFTSAMFELRNMILMPNIRCIAMPKLACGLAKMDWSEISALLYNVFNSSGKRICLCELSPNYQIPSSTQ